MLFNSQGFIFVFFPLVLCGFFLVGARSPRAAAGFLALASLFFYGWWSTQALPLLLASVCANYAFGLRLTPAREGDERARKAWLVVALVVNLGLLAVFKYANFFIANVSAGLVAAGLAPLPVLDTVLPIGISFYTFTQIAFLVDCWQGKVRERGFVHYLLFVTYFPHLIAGPVLHHAQMMPQFADPATYRPHANKLALGLAIFTLGLAKKLLIADPMGQYADLVFDGARQGQAPLLFTAWLGTLAYTLQIYFDFSGYSDMAVGLSMCLGVQLPLNFHSPYKAHSIAEFWRRWHISLSTFLRDYLYVPLGGNRKGPVRRYANLFLTMLLGGLWHGAAWTFVAWGALHGLFLTVNHLWAARVRRHAEPGPLARLLGWLLTMVCVMVAWVLFRADGMPAALTMYKGMLGLHGAPLQAFAEPGTALPYPLTDFLWLASTGVFICLALPPAITLSCWVPRVRVLAGHPRLGTARIGNLLTVLSATATVALLGASLLRMGKYSPFLYFQF
jgi:alginate O-acetyltransferase complex protein AlgI